MITIVLIPGLMNDAAVWSAMLGPLSRLAPISVAGNDGLDDLGAMAARILASTAGPLLVAGHSMGGRVALETVALAPERVAALALLSTGAHAVAPQEGEGRQRLVRLAEDEGMAAVARAWLPPMIAPEADPAMVAAIEAMLLRCRPADFAAQQHALLNRRDRTDLLPAIACPTLVMTGAGDRWSSPAQHRAMAEAIPGATLAIVPGAGHMLPIEAPDTVSERLAQLFARARA